MAAIQPKNTNDILVDSIGEKTALSGLTLVNDTTALTGLFTNDIDERTVSSGVTIDGVLLKDGFAQLLDVVAPSNPGSAGWRMYSDSSDSILKARDDAGVIRQVSNFPTLFSSTTAGADTVGGGFTPVITDTITAESDELIFAIMSLQCTNSSPGTQIGAQITIDGNAGRVLFTPEDNGSTDGLRNGITVFHTRTGLSGSIVVNGEMRPANGGTAHTAASTLHIFQVKFRT
jgi:hypothetical protein